MTALSNEYDSPVHRDPVTGEVIAMPGVDGIPFRGDSIPLVREDDAQQPEIVLDAKVRVFDLSNPEQLTDYENVIDLVAKGVAIISFEDHQFVPENRNWVVLLRWCQQFTEMPAYTTSKGSVDAQGQLTFRKQPSSPKT